MNQDKKPCSHADEINNVKPSTTEGCEECLKISSTWVNLRMCMICGKVGCCDSSPNTHATKHFEETGHKIIRSFQPGENWYWCYIDNQVFELD